MSGDEILLLIVSIALGPGGWLQWFYRLTDLEAFRQSKHLAPVMAAIVVGCGCLIAATLVVGGAPDVRNSPAYLLLYLALGLAWLRLGEFACAFAGVSVRDDVVERRNLAAVPALAGALIGIACCYAGGNIGAGPGWTAVVWSASLATAGLAAIWLAADRFGSASDVVTIDRDIAAGVRVGGLLTAGGMVLGRAVAGDWHSAGATVADFLRLGWVVVPLAMVAILVERAIAPTPARPRGDVMIGGALPAVVYVAAAAGYIFLLGWPA
jgi:hypothetical protein